MNVRRTILAALLIPSMIIQASAILAPNGSFTNGTTMPTNWSLSHEGHPSNVTAARDVSVFRTEPASLRVQSGSGGHTEGFVSCQLPVNMVKAGPFTVKGWTKKTSGIIHVVVQPFNKDMSNSWDHQLTLVEGYDDWSQWEFEYTATNPTNLQMVFLNFFIDNQSATAWMDDIELISAGQTAIKIPLQQAKNIQSAKMGPESFRILDASGRTVPSSAKFPAAGLRILRHTSTDGRIGIK